MTAEEALLLAQTCTTELKRLIPVIRDATTRGEISVEQERELLNDISSIRGQGGTKYSGAQWEQAYIKGSPG